MDEKPITAFDRRARALIDWLGVYGVFWRDRIDALSDLLNRMDT